MHEMIAEEIKKYIKERQLKRGDKLPSVAKLMSILGVSRSSIRESLRYLEGIDVIEVQNGKGIYVRDGDTLRIEAKIDIQQEKDYLLYISELRRALEGKAVELAAIRASDEEIHVMEQLLKEVIIFNEGGLDSSDVDWKFHKAIYKASHNPLLESVAESVSDTFNKLWSNPFGIVNIFSDTIPYHRTMLDGIKRHDPEFALQEFNKFIDIAERTLRKI